MHSDHSLELESLLERSQIKRRKLIPIWIKVFIWIFMIFGAFVPLVLLITLPGGQASLAIYGLETQYPYSGVGLLICSLFLFKGCVAYFLWAEKDIAIRLGIADAILGMAVCLFVMFIPLMNAGSGFRFRLELVLLIPYLLWLIKIKNTWELKGVK